MSSCMAYGITAGKPLAQLAVERGTPALWQNSPVFIIVMGGGFTTNLIWCVILNIRNRSGRDYVAVREASLIGNYFFSALAGITWYFLSSCSTAWHDQMGHYDFSSWTLHMAFHHRLQQSLGAGVPRMEGVKPAHVWNNRCRHRGRSVATVVIGLGNYLAALDARTQRQTEIAMASRETMDAQTTRQQGLEP